MMTEEIDWTRITHPSLKFYDPPQPNWKLSFGDDTNFCFQFYVQTPPNTFQRWMFKKILGITWKSVI